MAALLTALFIFPASLLRPLGGYLSDKFGPRPVTYSVFLLMTVAIVPLCLPASVLPLSVTAFTALLFVVGVGMGIGEGERVTSTSRTTSRTTSGPSAGWSGCSGPWAGSSCRSCSASSAGPPGVPQAAFVALLAITLGSLVWLHLVVMRIKAAEKVVEPAAVPEAV